MTEKMRVRKIGDRWAWWCPRCCPNSNCQRAHGDEWGRHNPDWAAAWRSAAQHCHTWIRAEAMKIVGQPPIIGPNGRAWQDEWVSQVHKVAHLIACDIPDTNVNMVCALGDCPYDIGH